MNMMNITGMGMVFLVGMTLLISNLNTQEDAGNPLTRPPQEKSSHPFSPRTGKTSDRSTGPFGPPQDERPDATADGMTAETVDRLDQQLTAENPGDDPFAREMVYGKATAKERNFQTFSERLVREIAAAKKPEELAGHVEDLQRTLNMLFDTRTERRNREIARLRQRVERLERQNEQRIEMKEEIVRLKLKSLVNEARGLKF